MSLLLRQLSIRNRFIAVTVLLALLTTVFLGVTRVARDRVNQQLEATVTRELAVMARADELRAAGTLDAQAQAEQLRLTAAARERLAAARAEAREMDRQIGLGGILGGAAIMAILAGVMWLTYRSVREPIEAAKALAGRIEQHDLSHRLVIDGRDETAELLRSLEAMQASLRGLVGQVRSSSDSIGTASTEIASGNQDLSSRTEQTASNLQQTASAMEQLTATVRNSADSAAQANQLAASAAEVAQRGGSVVSQVVSTMDEINASSKKISDIIG
ncbi:MAG: HAMP domain-containing protein, partial [Piscinibacter sp.]|uniref:HAMP domain-containing protein n=1 Tax=Piscinibacter sp. TaxID=1903157 RepID=UPI003D130D58